MVPRNTAIIYRGKLSIDYPAQGNPYIIHSPPSERRDIWGVGTVILYGCTLTCYPLRFNTWGTREICFWDARASVSIQETFEVRFEPCPRVFCLPSDRVRIA